LRPPLWCIPQWKKDISLNFTSPVDHLIVDWGRFFYFGPTVTSGFHESKSANNGNGKLIFVLKVQGGYIAEKQVLDRKK